MADEQFQVTAGEPRWSGDGSRVFVPVLVDGERQSELELEWDGSEFAPVTAAGFDESKHPRAQAGQHGGGRFIPKAGDTVIHPSGVRDKVSTVEVRGQNHVAMTEGGEEITVRPSGNATDEYGKPVQVRRPTADDKKREAFAKIKDLEDSGKITQKEAQRRYSSFTASVESQESAPDDGNRERQAEELCPYCNGTGRKGERAMAAAGIFDESKHPRAPSGQRDGGRFIAVRSGAGSYQVLDKATGERQDVKATSVQDAEAKVRHKTALAEAPPPDRLDEQQFHDKLQTAAESIQKDISSDFPGIDTGYETYVQVDPKTGKKVGLVYMGDAGHWFFDENNRKVEMTGQSFDHLFSILASAWEPGFLTASAAGLVPDVPPLSWFEMREPNEPTPLTITADGQIYGHGWLWNTCHTGQPGRCTTAPRSQSGYRFFHLGGVETQEGVTVATGKITFGAGHAPLTASRAGTAAHYDNSAHAGADVVVRDGKWGGWVTGSLRPDLPAKVVRTLRAAALSGDWRSVNGSLELIGLLAVNVPGFPVPRAQAALAASGTVDEDAVEALVAAGVMLPVEDCEPCVEEELDELLALVAAADPLDELLAPVAINNLLVDVGAASPQLAYAGPESTVPVVLDSQSAEDVRRRTRMQAARMVGNEPLAMALENAPDAVFESDAGKTVSVTVNIASASAE